MPHRATDTVLRATAAAALAALLLLLAAVSPASAQSVHDGWDAVDAGEHRRAESIFNRLADQGDPDAMYALGRMAYDGIGRPVDFPRAAHWFRRAAEGGNLNAQLNIGFMLSLGLGVPKNEAAAERWYGEAVARGDRLAMNNLAYIWATQGRNLDEALQMIRVVVAEAPDHSAYLDTLGWILVQMGHYEQAIPPMCRAVMLEPGHPEMRRNLGDAYWLAGNVPAAMLQWNQGLALFESPALLSNDGTPYFHSEDGAIAHADLLDRIENGFRGRPAAAGTALSEDGIEATFIDECQIPTT